MSAITRFIAPHAFLSNFAPAKVKWEGVVYPTVENAFQAAKILESQIGSPGARMLFTEFGPGEAKRRGRTVHLRPDWEQVKVPLMRALVLQKFTIHEDLRRSLFTTYPEKLEEGNDWGDTFWGTVNGEGRNMLGSILMDVRRELWVLAGEPVPKQEALV